MMVLSRRSKVLVALGSTVVTVVLLVWLAQWLNFRGGAKDPAGRYSTVSRTELQARVRTQLPQGLLVPIRLPAGVRSHDWADDEDPFELRDLWIYTGGHRARKHPSKRDADTVYVSDALSMADGGTTQYRIHQGYRGEPPRHHCPGSLPHVSRVVDHRSLLICSRALTKGSTALHYWRTVRFTTDLRAVRWLRG